MNKAAYLLCLCLSLTGLPGQAQKAKPTVSLATELQTLSTLASLPVYQDNVISAQVSSYDRTGGNDDGFSGKYSFLKRNADSTLVIFDVKGPGVISRIWTPTPSDDSLAFYIDDLTQPAFIIRYRDLFSGKVFPFVAPLCGNQLGGFYCYLPIPFQSHCKIVYRGKKTQFYQVQYKTFSTDTRVQKFNMKLSVEEDELLSNVKTLWSMDAPSPAHFYPGQKILESAKTMTLLPNHAEVAFKIEKGGRILGMEFSPATALEGLSKDVDIKITWDNEKIPAVYCPAADFLGYAFGKASMKSLLIGTAHNKNYCWFPMPFDKSAQVEFILRKPEGAGTNQVMQAKIFYTMDTRKPETEGKFYTYWNRNNPAEQGKPHVFLRREGKGHYVGTALQAQGLKAGMTYFFEGDDSTVVDGELRMHGTGSEDYFNGGWYALPDRWDAAMSLPLSGALDYSLPLCRTGGYRLFLSDKIPFEKNIHHAIEHGPAHNKAPVDYTSISYYYCSTPPAVAPAPTVATTRIFLPDTLTLYPQLMAFGTEGHVEVNPSWTYPTGGATYTFTVGKGASIRIPLDGVPMGKFSLSLDFVKSPRGVDFSLWQRQSQISDWVSGYSSTTERRESDFIGQVQVDELIHTITLRFQPQKDRDQFVLNRIILIRK